MLQCISKSKLCPMSTYFFLPPNASSLIQPLVQGIIKSCKDYYKRHLMDLVSLEIDNNENLTKEDLLKKINYYDAIIWIEKSWENVTVDCIKNCFRKSLENAKVGMIFKYSEEFDNEKNKLFLLIILLSLFMNWIQLLSSMSRSSTNQTAKVQTTLIIQY